MSGEKESRGGEQQQPTPPPIPPGGKGKGGKGKGGSAGAGAFSASAAHGADVGREFVGDVVLPLEIGSKVLCRWTRSTEANDMRMAKVVERRPSTKRPASAPPDPTDFEYYVHFTEFNRRNDTWVVVSQMDMSTLNLDDIEVKDAQGRVVKKRKEDHHVEEGHEDFNPSDLREHEEYTKVRNILTIELGKHVMDTWYYSPFPPEYNDCHILYFCEFTLNFFKRKEQMQRHLKKVEMLHPPGDEIYRKGSLAMFEVDGRKERQYCQNLCYLAKLFLDHKTLYYDVDLFLFYVECEEDERGCHVVGYFSKEKSSDDGYNLACILTLPPYQRLGYGKFLIAFSYELSKKEGKVGTPERPLSDLGLVSYRSYWTRILLNIIKTRSTVSIKELSEETMFKTEDIVSTLQHLNMLAYQKGAYVIVAEPQQVAAAIKSAGSAGVEVDSQRLIWTPYNAERDYSRYRS